MSLVSPVARAVIRAGKKATTTVAKEAKNVLVNHTQIGRRLREGVHTARQAIKTSFTKLSKESDDVVNKYMDKLNIHGYNISRKLSNDNQFVALYNRYAEKTGLNKLKPDGKNDEQIFQELIETAGVGPTKFAQIISSDEKIMSKIKNEALKEAIRKTRSNCSFSRTIEEAQEVLNNSFPGKNYVIMEELRAGSIGAAYKVKRPDGSTAVLKMLKKGVDKEQLDLEEKLFTRLIKELDDSPKEVAKHQGMLKSWYKDWAEELNFNTEYANNKLLAKGAQRYKVADITDISKNGTCIVMDMANGIQMNKLIKILNDYKTNPAEFAAKYADEIKDNPWLANPEKVMKDLPTTILKTFDEQFMFMKKGGKSLMHGDPHTGNFFITTDKNGKLIPEFIDTGNCVSRTSKQIKEDIKFFTNYFVGNSEGVAKYFVNQCGYNKADKAEVINKIAAEIQKDIFGKKQNITNFEDVQNTINVILEKYGLQMSTENATAMKAQMQFFTAINEAGQLTGKKLDLGTIIKDIPKASWGMIKTGTNPWSSIKEALKFAYNNQRQAVGTAYQFSINDVDDIVETANRFEKMA